MQLLDIGPRGYTTKLAVNNATFTPLYDRAAKVTDVRITSISAVDVWTFSVGGKELFRTRINTVGYQNPFGSFAGAALANRSWLDYISDLLGMEVTIPVPNGQTLTVASVGGATANISIEYKEVSPADIQASLINHYQGNRFIHPLVHYMTAQPVGLAPQPLDTQVAPPYLPKLLAGNPIPPGWKINLLAMWAEPWAQNLFSGGIDHMSETQELQVKKNGQVMWTRDDTGVPFVAQAAASGSTNVVYLPSLLRHNPFQFELDGNNQWFDPMISLSEGDNFEVDVTYNGTGAIGISPLNNMVLFLADITQVGA